MSDKGWFSLHDQGQTLSDVCSVLPYLDLARLFLVKGFTDSSGTTSARLPMYVWLLCGCFGKAQLGEDVLLKMHSLLHAYCVLGIVPTA